MTWGLIFEWILNDSRMTLEWLYDDFRMTSGWLWNNFRMTLEWFWMTFSRLFYFERTYCPISNIVSFQISHDLIQNPLVDLYLNFEKIKLENSILTNWIFSLQKSISKLIFSGYTGSKNPVRQTLFFKIQYQINMEFNVKAIITLKPVFCGSMVRFPPIPHKYKVVSSPSVASGNQSYISKVL